MISYVRRVREAAITGKKAIDAAAKKLKELEDNKADNLARWEFEISEARRKGQKPPASTPYDRYNQEYTRLDIEVSRAKTALRDELDGLYTDYVDGLHDANTLKADELNDDAKFLNFNLTERDFADIVARNTGNYTMIRLFTDYAKDRPELLPLLPPNMEDEQAKAAKQLRDFCYYAAVNGIWAATLMDDDAFNEQVPEALK